MKPKVISNLGQKLYDPNLGRPVQPIEELRRMRWIRELCRDLISAYYTFTKGETDMTLYKLRLEAVWNKQHPELQLGSQRPGALDSNPCSSLRSRARTAQKMKLSPHN